MQLSEYLGGRGNLSNLSKKMGISHSLLSRWASHRRRVPAERVLDIEAATEGKVTRHELRPDLYPPNGRKRAA